jgi:pyruvate formate lyase activating enzyme
MIVGKEYGVGELVQELLKDLEFFTCSGGGVTFSGGEPMAQAEFVFACAKELRAKHISVALETSGFWAARFTGKIAGCFDTVLLDLKHAMPDKFKRTVGRDLKIVAENLKGLISNGAEMEIRLTLVPGFNDTVQDLAGIARFLKSCGYRKAVRLQSFHRMAKAKEALLCKKYPYGDSMPVSAGRMAEAAEFLGRAGIEVA